MDGTFPSEINFRWNLTAYPKAIYFSYTIEICQWRFIEK